MEEDKQHQCSNNICLYYGELGHVACECLKERGQHVACAISITKPQLKESKSEHVQSQ
jgi:hypothetical protein